MLKFLISLLSGADAASSADLVSQTEIISDTDVVSLADAGFKFEPDNFVQALPTIGICLLSIFVVMLTIILITSLLNKITAVGKKGE